MENCSEPIDIIELDIKRIARQNLFWTIFLMISFLLVNGFIHGEFAFHISIFNFFLFFILYIGLIVIHEICHLIGFLLFGRVPISSLKYGVNLKMGVAYATTTRYLHNRAMKKSLLLPFWITGVIPAMIGFILNNNLWLILGAWLIAGAVGDFAMYKKLRKFPKNYFIRDDPKLPKLYIYKN
ncbi:MULTISPECIES: DUF3267 domain-containing protein [unclassified Rummeliibacillus]|uniref:DUF3267 domain-containing protein n=1 Tax=unclassified Rummeliibacillus TaxID=2622809 RepID=UPI000E662089|nr:MULTISPECIES: DUF3267 domain-containing protein [unclassified Rummeliibacillus]RIJ63651.1 DUF3267 domain-containing protein [Rummeliibacillus sp. POC4]RPJ94903.1 DUF3267 domain-containing protein [Rummeliibacillus sp. TYF005]